MTSLKVALPRFAKAYLSRISRPLPKAIVPYFHLWLEQHNVRLSACRVEDVTLCLEQLRDSNESLSNRYEDCQIELSRYLTYVYLQNKFSFNPQLFLQKKTEPRKRKKAQVDLSKYPHLPLSALRYLKPEKTRQSYKILNNFHLWLSKQQLDIATATPEQIYAYIDGTRDPLCSFRYQQIKREIKKYLRNLYSQLLLSFNPDESFFTVGCLGSDSNEFLAELAVSLKRRTVNGYRTSLLHFHKHIRQHNLELSSLNRSHIIPWIADLQHDGLHPSTRYTIIGQIRTYLRWAYDRGLLVNSPEELIRVRDFPKIPNYLPRPLAPEIDRALQDYLSNIATIYAKGLLVMRRSGIRIGELCSLEFDCIRTDSGRAIFLKVPLGKLYTERLVPITSDTFRLITEIQQEGQSPRCYLVSTVETMMSDFARFAELLNDFSTANNITPHIKSHQLRHTAATELINSGMSLTSIMRFLGHKDFRMTLRYASITQKTIVSEFNQAMVEIENRYQLPQEQFEQKPFNPETMVNELIQWININAPAAFKTKAHTGTRKLRSIKQLIALMGDKPK